MVNRMAQHHAKIQEGTGSSLTTVDRQSAPAVAATQQTIFEQVTCRLGDGSCAQTHSATLKQAPAAQRVRIVASLLELQRQYGNHFVQRVVALSRQASGTAEADPGLERDLEATRGGGRMLDRDVRGDMEAAFGVSFAGVRVHTDAAADGLSRALDARAFTTGQDLFFRQGEYSPGSLNGRELIAHELTHVVQQTGGQIRRKLAVSAPGDRFEQEADQVARAIVETRYALAQNARPTGAVVDTRSDPGTSPTEQIRTRLFMIQRDLAIEPPHPTAEGRTLTAEQMQDAINYNNGVVGPAGANVIEMIRDVIGISATPAVVNEDFVNGVVRWQAWQGLTQDGKLGPNTAAPLFREIGAEGVGRAQVKSGPQYTPSGTIPTQVSGTNKNANFSFSAEFENDPANGLFPSCGELRQYIRWDAAAAAGFGASGVPHGGFPAGTASGVWIEDRDDANKRYGHRSGRFADPQTFDQYLDSTGARNQAFGHTYQGSDRPGGPSAGLAGVWEFAVQCVDVCHNEREVGRNSYLRIVW